MPEPCCPRLGDTEQLAQGYYGQNALLFLFALGNVHFEYAIFVSGFGSFHVSIVRQIKAPFKRSVGSLHRVVCGQLRFRLKRALAGQFQTPTLDFYAYVSSYPLRAIPP